MSVLERVEMLEREVAELKRTEQPKEEIINISDKITNEVIKKLKQRQIL